MIRKLTRKDRKALTDMIEKMAKKIGDNSLLTSMVSDATKSASSQDASKSDAYVAMGVEVFKTLYEFLEEDFCLWLADICGMTMEEYDKQPFDIDLRVMNEVVEAEEFGAFFTGVSELAKKTKRFVGRFKSLKTASDSETA